MLQKGLIILKLQKPENLPKKLSIFYLEIFTQIIIFYCWNENLKKQHNYSTPKFPNMKRYITAILLIGLARTICTSDWI
jgi:hypothetical protein